MGCSPLGEAEAKCCAWPALWCWRGLMLCFSSVPKSSWMSVNQGATAWQVQIRSNLTAFLWGPSGMLCSCPASEEEFWGVCVWLGLSCLGETKNVLEREWGPTNPDGCSLMFTQRQRGENQLHLWGKTGDSLLLQKSWGTRLNQNGSKGRQLHTT